MNGAKDQADTYCFDLVRTGDKDRFLASLFAPDDLRPHLLTLYAFNIEIARIRDVVSEPALGEIRLQWWLDAIDSIYASDAPAHPVTQALARAVEKGSLPQAALRNMIEARRFDLYDDPMPTLNDLEGYLGETASALIQMGALILGGNEARKGAIPAGNAGVAMGISGLLRTLPLHRSRGQCYLPVDMLSRHGLTPSHVFAARPEDNLHRFFKGFRDIAAKRLSEARALQAQIPAPALPAFLPATLTDLYLDQLKRLDISCLKETASISQLRRQWRLYWSARKKVF